MGISMMEIKVIVDKQREFFLTGKTLSYEWRMKALTRLEQAVREMEGEINEALKKDLNKSSFESCMTEVGMTLSEIGYVKKHLKKWMRDSRVSTPLAQFPAKSFQTAEPYGVVLIMSPWNYPFLLSIEPLVGAIAAGNCCVLKPSAYSEASAAVIAKLIHRVFPEKFAAVITGGRKENTRLLEQRFDYIFFTGSPSVGKLVMEKAAKHLTPISLELGGKSPCIVDETADLSLAAKRIVFGKFLNSGQTCVAPDYVLVKKEREEELLGQLEKWIRSMYGQDPLENPDYPKMINEKHFKRVLGLIRQEKVAAGGTCNAETMQIAPTVLRGVTLEDPVMQEEIFGPVLPVLTWDTKEDLLSVIRSYEKPLALYLFSNDRKLQRFILSRVSFGGGCINDTIIHLATSEMGFGGVGGSGMGSYHGKDSFDTFTHRKSIVKKSNRLDLPVRYQPYTKFKEKLLRKFMS